MGDRRRVNLTENRVEVNYANVRYTVCNSYKNSGVRGNAVQSERGTQKLDAVREMSIFSSLILMYCLSASGNLPSVYTLGPVTLGLLSSQTFLVKDGHLNPLHFAVPSQETLKFKD